VLNRAVDLKTGNSWMQAGYASYGFFDSESNVLPFAVGTYVGTKKVLNVGAGFQRMPKTTQSWALSGEDTVRRAHDVNMLAVDVFADLPFGGEKNMAVTAYSVFYLHRWGPNYYRLVGIMNEASVATAGNARPLLGTGSIWYTQAGLLLPKGFMGLKDRVQPFAAYTLHNIERLKTPANSFDLGFNYYISGHHSKLTLQYSSRPRIVSGAQDGSRGEFIVQAQVYL
jgi:hypothetical protein